MWVKNYSGGDQLKGLQHMELYGIDEGRKFSPFVDLSLYMNMNSDISYAYGGSRISSLRHLANYGVAEGRRFAIGYDSNYYRSVNSDLSSFNNLQLLGHFEQYGVNEGRASAQSFNVNYYLSNNADLRNLGFSYLSAFQHFNTYGYSEGRLGATPLLLSGDPGNTLASAFNLDLPRNIYSTTYSNFVGTSDLDDYYKFSLAYTSTISINVNISIGNQRVRTFLFQDTDNNGVFNTSSDIYYVAGGYTYATSSISKTLGAGTYFIYIQPFPSGSSTNYTLGLTASSATVTTPRDPGPKIATALPISSGQAFTDFVGFTDSADYYRFTLGNTSNVNVTVNGLSESVTTHLLHDTDNNGVLDTSFLSDLNYVADGDNYSPASISKTLGAGTYFIYIEPKSRQDNTNYTLKLTASSATVTTPRDPGSQLATALPIVSGQVFTDFVGSTDSADYYSFTLGNTRNVNVTVNGLSESEDVETYLFQDTNNDGVFNTSSDIYSLGFSAASLASTLSISKTLGAGTYFIYIKPWRTQDNTNYTLRLLT
jgi:hypothetical protein